MGDMDSRIWMIAHCLFRSLLLWDQSLATDAITALSTPSVVRHTRCHIPRRLIAQRLDIILKN